MTTFNVIGKKAARKDGPLKVTGEAEYRDGQYRLVLRRSLAASQASLPPTSARSGSGTNRKKR